MHYLVASTGYLGSTYLFLHLYVIECTSIFKLLCNQMNVIVSLSSFSVFKVKPLCANCNAIFDLVLVVLLDCMKCQGTF